MVETPAPDAGPAAPVSRGVPARVRRSALAAREIGGLLGARRPRAVYVGPARSSNAGDTLLHDVHRRLLAPMALPPLQTPLGARILGAAPWRSRGPGLLLGGGTLIGEPRWRHLLEAADPTGCRSLWALGPGALDPRSTQFAWVAEELRAWEPLLRRLQPIAVRGPLSAEVLADLGLDAQVVGDPVLALPSPPGRPAVPGRLGINVGATQVRRTFGRTDDLVAVLGNLARAWTRAGGHVLLFSVWPPDDAVCRAVGVAAGRALPLVRWTDRVDDFLADLQSCEVVVAQKLHAAVMTVVARRPVVPVEYQAKCRDFAASIGLNDVTPRMDSCTGEQLLELVQLAQAAATHQVERVQDQRARLTEKLRKTAADVVAAQSDAE